MLAKFVIGFDLFVSPFSFDAVEVGILDLKSSIPAQDFTSGIHHR